MDTKNIIVFEDHLSRAREVFTEHGYPVSPDDKYIFVFTRYKPGNYWDLVFYQAGLLIVVCPLDFWALFEDGTNPYFEGCTIVQEEEETDAILCDLFGEVDYA